MVREESHRATYRMHHFQPSRIYETGSSIQTRFSGYWVLATASVPVEQSIQQKHNSRANEHRQGHLRSRFFVHFWN